MINIDIVYYQSFGQNTLEADLLQFIKEMTIICQILQLQKMCHQTRLKKHFLKPIKLAVMQEKIFLGRIFSHFDSLLFCQHDFPTGNLRMRKIDTISAPKQSRISDCFTCTSTCHPLYNQYTLQEQQQR